MERNDIKWTFNFIKEAENTKELDRRRFVLKKIDWKPEVSVYRREAFGSPEVLFNETLNFLRSNFGQSFFLKLEVFDTNSSYSYNV